MSLPHPVSDELAELIARQLQAMAEPMRIKLLDRLRDGEASVSELVVASRCSQQNVSKHLAVLAQAGIVSRRRQGNRVYYRISDETVFELCDRVCTAIERRFSELGSLLER